MVRRFEDERADDRARTQAFPHPIRKVPFRYRVWPHLPIDHAVHQYWHHLAFAQGLFRRQRKPGRFQFHGLLCAQKRVSDHGHRIATRLFTAYEQDERH